MNRTTTTLQEPQQRPSHSQQQEPPTAESPSGCLVRLYWMFLGNGLVAVSGYLIVQAERAFSVADLVYWLGAASLIGVRYVDVRYLAGRTAEGEPATMRNWHRYWMAVLATTTLAWAAIHGVRYLTT